MATIASLNIKLGADIRNLQRDLNKAKRELRQSSKDFAEIGKGLTFGISLPLAGFGALAVKAAGDVEALRLTMRTTFQDAGRSIQEADAEMEALRQSAMAPGLDFPQAIKGSVRLQNVGMQAEAARKTIEELANTISMSGGTAEDLDGVTIQFAQMISKGKVLSQDLRIIQERMPKISSLMKEAFGTSNAEMLQKMGVTGEEFIAKITEKMQALPRVAGGINNSIVNLGAGVRNFLATIGEDINKTFNLQQRFDDFANWLTGLGKSFAGLDTGTKKAILTIGAFAIATGPAIFGLTKMFQFAGAVGIVYKNMVGAIGIAAKSVALWQAQVAAGEIGMSKFTMGIKAAGVAWKNMDAITKATTIGIVIAAIGLAVLAFRSLTGELTTAEKTQRTLSSVQMDAAKSIAGERLEAERLTSTLKNETATREKKEAALARLKEINKSYFGDLDTEKSKINDIDAALKNYIGSIEKRAKLAAANEKLIEIEKELLDVNEQSAKADPTFWQQAGNAILSGGNAMLTAAANTKTHTQNIVENRKALEAQKKALLDMISTAETPIAATKKAGGGGGGTGESKTRKMVTIPDLLPSVMDMEKSVGDLATVIGRSIEKTVPQVQGSGEIMKNALTALGEQFDVIDNKAAVFGDAFSPIEEKIKATESAIASLIENGASPFSNSVTTMIEKLAELKTGLDETKQKWADFGEGVRQAVNVALSESLVAFADGLGSLFAGIGSGKNLLAAMLMPMLDMLENIGKMAIATGVAVLGIKKALQSLNPVAAIAGGVALIALSKFVKSKLANSMPKLAEGGIVTAPTMAMVGDNRSGTEAIIPLEKMGQFFNSGNSNIHLTGDVRWSGREFVIAFEQAQKSMDRIRGPK